MKEAERKIQLFSGQIFGLVFMEAEKELIL